MSYELFFYELNCYKLFLWTAFRYELYSCHFALCYALCALRYAFIPMSYVAKLLNGSAISVQICNPWEFLQSFFFFVKSPGLLLP
jgi:hypothetical protein